MITGSLQKKNGSYYAALNLKVDGKRKVKWIATGLPVEGTSIRKAQKALDQIRATYEKLEEEQLVRSALETQRRLNPDAELMFQDYMAKWLKSSRSTIAATTYTSYNDMVQSRIRTLPLIPAVEELLLNVKEKQEMYKALFKKSYCPDYIDYVCVDQLGKILRPNYLTEHFAWLLEKYGLRKIRFHDLRHSCASLLLQNGISMKQIQIWLGHSTFSTTADIYAHLDYTAQEESAATMGSLFKKDRSADKKVVAGQ